MRDCTCRKASCVPASSIEYNHVMLLRLAPPTSSSSKPDRIGIQHRPRWIAYLALFTIAVSVALAAASGLGFSRSVSPRLVQRYADEFGPDSRTRIDDWQRFVRSVPAEQQRSGSEMMLLGHVNTFFNRLRFVTDLGHWGVNDYWASPSESVASGGADCEDFSIAKYFALKELGVPIQRLRITYVKALSQKESHMVLAYYSEPNAMPLILDNLENSIRPASERTDLTPVYSFNDEDLLVTRPGQRDTRAGSSSRIRLWRYLLHKLEMELLQ